MLLLTVHRNEEARTHHSEHELQLLLTGVSRNVDVIRLFVYYLGAQLHKLVDDLADHLLVSGNRRGRNNYEIARCYVDLTVVSVSHAVKCRHGLTLRARGDYYELVVGIAAQHIDIDQYSLGDAQIAELGRDVDDVDHAPAEDSDLTAVPFGSVDYLLYTVNVRGEGGNDYSLVRRLGEEVHKGLDDDALAHRKSRTLGVGRVGKKRKNALFSELG